MATTAMAMVRSINNSFCKKSSTVTVAILSLMFISPLVLAGDWKFTPSLALDETYTDNVELTVTDTSSSFVTQAIAGLSADYKSSVASVTFSGTKSYAMYSHDSDLNDDYQTLSAKGQYYLWTNGPAVIANANIANVSRNSARNSLADLVSGDTIENQNYSTGLQYAFGNSSYSVNSSLIYSLNRSEDNIGEHNGINAQLSSKNGSNARHVYWQMAANYNKRKQGLDNNVNNDGENYTVDGLIGVINRFNFNPFIRFYDENITGRRLSGNSSTTPSWGPGIRWLASPHLIIDLSYNFVADETISDNYVAATVQWEPSARTSLTAGYSQRFFGKAYNLNFKHKTKRLSNTITYNETLSIFDRNNYEEINPDAIELVESNQYSLNKRFSWSSRLQLSRTSFSIAASANERENLATNIIDDTLNANLTVTRTTSAKGSLSLSARYNYSIFDKDNPAGSRQEDRYRTLSTAYQRNLASSLSSNFTLQYVNRDSTNDRYSYDEVRAIINIRKEF